MATDFYLPRQLTDGSVSYTETELLKASNYIVVLAEPGGGKTRLLDSLAMQIGTVSQTANVFHHTAATGTSQSLVIDAFDEFAKVDVSGIYGLLGKAFNTKPRTVIVSSRSSEWNSSCNHQFEEFFKTLPLVVRLLQFSETEQRELFRHYAGDEDFNQFRDEVGRFDLEPLLPNPQFLQLFTDAYIASERKFSDKASIFATAIARLAVESNKRISPKTTATIEDKVRLSEELFAKILLSGAEGISSGDENSSDLYPRIDSLVRGDKVVHCVLDTRLFKPAGNPDQHQAVHKIVSEYCAATYLAKRVSDPIDDLSLAQCLAIIAPNGTVRDELRGMLGWFAALGSKAVQEAVIDLDPYAVLANGDPSRLLASSKRRLIHKLKAAAEEDPYFRRADIWRTFSAQGFFSDDVVLEIRALLHSTGEGGHLQGLILELLVGSEAVEKLIPDLQHLALSPTVNGHVRKLASRCLAGAKGNDFLATIAPLVFEASETSLQIAAEVIADLQTGLVHWTFVADFARVCAKIYPTHEARAERTIGARYFLTRFINTLDLETVQRVLDSVSARIRCTCGKKFYECECRTGLSKIAGSLIDRYFELYEGPYDATRIWRWLENLNFYESKASENSASVRELQSNDSLRQGIFKIALGHLTDPEEIFSTRTNHFTYHCHSGLYFRSVDYYFVVDMAYKSGNVALWTSFIASHQRYRKNEDRGPDAMRAYMRSQANNRAEFMRAWARHSHAMKEIDRKNDLRVFRRSRKLRSMNERKESIRVANIKYVQENRELIETGRHWSCISRFAELVLMQPEEITREFGDEILVRKALKNCFDFIEPYVPTLKELAELQCASRVRSVETILYAACLETLRQDGSLDGVKGVLLAALRTNLSMGFSAVTVDERAALERETNRLLFKTSQDIENFLRNYIEAQLRIAGCQNPQVSWLRYNEIFHPFRATLPLEWLTSFHSLSLHTLHELFDLAAEFGNRAELLKLIELRCAEFFWFWPNHTENEVFEEKRNFWFVRALYFLQTGPQVYWNWLSEDKNVLLVLNNRSGRIHRGESSYWPVLSAQKIEAILEAFVGVWPKVNLPDTWGSDSPPEESAYRFLTEIIWSIEQEIPEHALPVLNRMIEAKKYSDFRTDLRSIRASVIKKASLRDFRAPLPGAVVSMLDEGQVITVEGLRVLMIQELIAYQADLNGSETTTKDVFYEKGERLGEVPATLRIADRMRLKLEGKSITVTPEHQLKNANRCDYTCSKIINQLRRLLVVEVKGQWHSELFSAASSQLHERYSIHPNAEQQGIYLVLWYGPHEKVANKKKHGISSANDLKQLIESGMPPQLKGLVDVFVLDLSQP